MSESAQQQAAEKNAEKNAFTTITLSEPIKRGDNEIVSLQLRKPKAGELRGLDLQDILTSKVTTILKLVPRITEPVLTDDEANALDPADFAEIAGTVVGFFLTPSQKAAAMAMMEG